MMKFSVRRFPGLALLGCMICLLVPPLAALATETDVFVYRSRHGEMSVMVNFGSNSGSRILFDNVTKVLPILLGIEQQRSLSEPRYEIFVACQHLRKASLSLGGVAILERECGDADLPEIAREFGARLGEGKIHEGPLSGYALVVSVEPTRRAARRALANWLKRSESLDDDGASDLYVSMPGYAMSVPAWIEALPQKKSQRVLAGFFHSREQALRSGRLLLSGGHATRVVPVKLQLSRLFAYFPMR